MVISILNGALDSSTIVFLVFKLLYEEGINLQDISITYCILCLIVILGVLIFVMPRHELVLSWMEANTEDANVIKDGKGYQDITGDVGRDESSEQLESTPFLHTERSDQHMDKCTENEKEEGKWREVDGIFHYIFSSLYLFHLLFFCTIHLKLVCFVGSLEDYLNFYSDHNKEFVSSYINLFGFIQIGGIIVTPLIGLLFDRDIFLKDNDKMTDVEKNVMKRKQSILPLFITSALAIVLSTLALFDAITLQIPQYFLYTVVRGFLYACHGAYVAAMFPMQHFGTLLGLGFFAAATVAFLHYPLSEVRNIVFQGNPFCTNVILLVLVLTSAVHSVNVARTIRK